MNPSSWDLKEDAAFESETVGGFTLPDGLALVAGAAVASAHLRGALPTTFNSWSWLMSACAFLGITITATGPFFVGFGRWAGRRQSRPLLGEWLWLAMGAPWLLFSLARASLPASALRGGWATQGFQALLAAVCVSVAVLAWKRLIQDSASSGFLASESRWSNFVGLTLAILAPLQLVLMLLIGGRP